CLNDGYHAGAHDAARQAEGSEAARTSSHTIAMRRAESPPFCSGSRRRSSARSKYEWHSFPRASPMYTTEAHGGMRRSRLWIMWFVLPEEKTGAPGKTRRISSVARDTFSLGCSLKITGRPATTSCTRARKRARLSHLKVSRASEVATRT